MVMTDLSKAPLVTVKRITALGTQLAHSGVRSLYIGDGDHHSTSVALNETAIAVGFHPDLLFIEEGAEYQARCDSQKWRSDNFIGDEVVTKATHARLFAVDDSEISKLQPLTTKVMQIRVSSQTHDRIAGRIVAHISDFYFRFLRSLGSSFPSTTVEIGRLPTAGLGQPPRRAREKQQSQCNQRPPRCRGNAGINRKIKRARKITAERIAHLHRVIARVSR